MSAIQYCGSECISSSSLAVPVHVYHVLKLNVKTVILQFAVQILTCNGFYVGHRATAVSVGELYEQVGANQCALAQHTWWQQRRCQCVSGQFVLPLLLLCGFCKANATDFLNTTPCLNIALIKCSPAVADCLMFACSGKATFYGLVLGLTVLCPATQLCTVCHRHTPSHADKQQAEGCHASLPEHVTLFPWLCNMH